MSWHEGKHFREIPVDLINNDWQNVKGDLNQEQAAIWFTKFLSCNPAAASEFLIGKKFGRLHAIQDIIIRTWFQRDYNLLVAGRGFSKSYTTALFIVLYSIFNPGVKVAICSASFRQAKMLFETIEKFIQNSEGGFLKQCSPGDSSRGTDAWKMKIGTSEITAMPLTEKIRGYRAQLVIVDEYLSVPEKIINEIIRPFMTVKRGNGAEQRQIKEAEQYLIDNGELEEWERTIFTNNKIIALSSATYKFEPLYKNTYLKYLESIHDPAATGVSHSLFRLSYQCAPKDLLDTKMIEEARRTASTQQFDREYNALFTDESGGFYNMQHIQNATIPLGEEPKIKLRGDKNLQYIVSVDPNFSAGSDDADNFALSVFELVPDGSFRATLVHGYALAKSDVKNRSVYFSYILNNFNVVLIILDNAGGGRFLEEYNALMPKDQNIYSVDIDFSDEVLFQKTKSLYNRHSGHIAICQIFNKKNWIRDANDALQGDIQHKKMMFGSRITFSDVDREMNMNYDIGIENIEFKNGPDFSNNSLKQSEFIDHVEMIVENTRKELALIQVKTDAVGNQSFDLPRELRITSGKDRARRDSYTSLLLGNYGRRCYERLMKEEDYEEEVFAGFFIN